jgi:flavin-dependent dehydrogenase
VRTCDALVIGAGPAGSAAAGRLASAGLEVMLCDKDAFPRDKLCGEVLSPESARYLRELGADDRIDALAGSRLGSVRFIGRNGGSLERPLPGPGLGLRRRTLDAALVAFAVDRGAAWLPSTRARVVQEGGAIRLVRAGKPDEDVRARVVIHATGRPAASRDPGFVAFQRHYMPRTDHSPGNRPADTTPGTTGVVEIALFDGGYCGIAPVDSGLVNLCLLARAEVVRDGGGSPERLASRIAKGNEVFACRLAALQPVEERFRSAAGFSFGLASPDRARLTVGDSAGMIAPICGDGISMALRSAEIGAEEAAAYLREGRGDWESCCARVQTRWRSEVATRMRLGGAIQRILLSRSGSVALFSTTRAFPRLADWLILRTRG